MAKFIKVLVFLSIIIPLTANAQHRKRLQDQCNRAAKKFLKDKGCGATKAQWFKEIRKKCGNKTLHMSLTKVSKQASQCGPHAVCEVQLHKPDGGIESVVVRNFNFANRNSTPRPTEVIENTTTSKTGKQKTVAEFNQAGGGKFGGRQIGPGQYEVYKIRQNARGEDRKGKTIGKANRTKYCKFISGQQKIQGIGNDRNRPREFGPPTNNNM